jgi:PHD/YefM family antitoxin component YafN of YafNO toxin-antitoxin module
MADITNSHSLTDFQRNARGFIEGLNKTKEPLLITVNGKVQAVLVDPVTFQEMEARAEKQRFISALREGLNDIDEGRTRSLDEVVADIRAKHDL